ncbi:tripartite tricarboxylate transporter substrate binding protein [Alcaligenaceae bacterium]|nr:tripartite tricarboxylate transporter substrate binding protein [Alcaligenaceae bacterium]
MKKYSKLLKQFLCLCTATMCSAAFAQDWPSRAVTIVVPFAAAGPTDFIARILAEPLSKELGQPVIVANRPGASGTIGVHGVKESTPDGYTLVHTTIAAQALNPVLYPDWKVVPQKDFALVGTTATLPNILVVSPELGVSSLDELIKLAKSKDGELTYATFGVGTSPHILGMLLQKSAGFKAISVPYKGSAPALLAVLGGQIGFSFDNITTSSPQIKAGKIKGLAIAAPNRSKILPDIPTLAEQGLSGFDLSFGFTLSAPAGVPQDVLDKLQKAFQKVVQSPAYAEALQSRGAEPLLVKSADLPAYIKQADDRWLQVADELNLKADRK